MHRLVCAVHPNRRRVRRMKLVTTTLLARDKYDIQAYLHHVELMGIIIQLTRHCRFLINELISMNGADLLYLYYIHYLIFLS